MKCRELFNAALALLNEQGGANANADYAERAPYILASMCCENAETDLRYRQTHGSEPRGDFGQVYIGLEEDFPLSDRFSDGAVFHLASMLILDENGDMSDWFYDKYCDSMLSIESELPGFLEYTVDVYGEN